MSLPHAILGLLQVEPMTGYDLKTIWFDRTITHFWSSDHTQIYRTLDKLAEQGLVESQIEYQEERPNRKVYTITESGRIELRNWLGKAQAPSTIRDAFMIQIFFGAQLPNRTLIELMEDERKVHLERLKHYYEILKQMTLARTLTRDETLRRLTVESGIWRERSYLEWLEEAITVVKGLKEVM